MRIIVVTANLPYGTDEAFLVPEITQLIRMGHEVAVVPRSPSGTIVHGASLVRHAHLQPLLSPGVCGRAAASSVAHFRELRELSGLLRQSRSPAITAKNLAVVPKAMWLAEFASAWGAHHIHCHWAGTTATMGMIASAISGIPWSFTAHRWDIVDNNLLAAKVASASMARFISEDGLKMARAIGIPDGDHVRVLHMGVNIPEKWRPRQTRSVALCPARLVEVKGHTFLLQAWRMLRERGVDAELWLAGGGELQLTLESMVARLEIQKSVRFLGTVPHRRLLQLYEEIGIAAVVLASVDMGSGCHEGIPVGLIEAMSYGIPVVATNTGGTPELIEWGTGLLVPPSDAAALANAVQSLLRDPERAARVGAYGRQHVMAKFDVTRVAAELERAFSMAKISQAAKAAA